MKAAVNLSGPLNYIKHCWDANGLTPLTVIVVNKKTGKPVSGMSLAATI